LLVIDNADDMELLFGGTRLSNYLPSNQKGFILFTTRNHKAAVELVGPAKRDVISVPQLTRDEALKLLEANLEKSETRDINTTKLLDFLADVPLAIKQASV